MDGGGRCQQSELGRFGTDRECKCAFCTERQLESQFGECSRCALGSNRQPSSSPAASAVSRLQHHAGANSVSVMTNSPSGEGGRSTMACTSIKGNQIGLFHFRVQANLFFEYWIDNQHIFKGLTILQLIEMRLKFGY